MKKFILPLILGLLFFGISSAQTQSWVPSYDGILDSQYIGVQTSGLHIKFKNDAAHQKDWIYGHWLDEDTLVRHVGYRSGGRWKSLPFYTKGLQYWTGDIEYYGDTLYIGGFFRDVVVERTGDTIEFSTLLKWYDDSLWTSTKYYNNLFDLDASGDSLLIFGLSYHTPDTIIWDPVLTTNGEVDIVPAFSVRHPTGGAYGLPLHAEFHKGDVYIINRDGLQPYRGVIRWDGSQWHSLGNGLSGTYSAAFDFTFYRDTLYMFGSFNKSDDSLNPGNYLVRWTGAYWEEFGGGIPYRPNTVSDFFTPTDLFVHSDVLYCFTNGSNYGDASIANLAGWDGSKWCGTPSWINGISPYGYGIVNDTLFSFHKYLNASSINGVNMGYLNYFDGDYLHGPNSICSTPGLEEAESQLANAEILIYPNPAKDVLTISLPQEVENASYEIIALDGRVVLSGALKGQENTVRVSLKLSGVYLLNVITKDGVISRKVVFE